MARKIILGGIVGAIVVFIVSSLWHTVLGLGEVGIKAMPDEENVAAAMRGSISQPGFYIFPAPNMAPGRSKEQQQADQAAYLSKFREGPNGILIYSPGGHDFNFGKALVNQFLFNLAGALILAWILAAGAGGTSYATRVAIVLMASIFAGVVFILPYWNWYGFPLTYVLGDMAGWAVSWFFGGLAMAKIIR